MKTKIKLTWRQARLLIKATKSTDKGINTAVFNLLTGEIGREVIHRVTDTYEKRYRFEGYIFKIDCNSTLYWIVEAFINANSFIEFKDSLERNTDLVWDFVLQTKFDIYCRTMQRKKEFRFLYQERHSYLVSICNNKLGVISSDIAIHMWDNYEEYFISYPTSIEDVETVYNLLTKYSSARLPK